MAIHTLVFLPDFFDCDSFVSCVCYFTQLFSLERLPTTNFSIISLRRITFMKTSNLLSIRNSRHLLAIKMFFLFLYWSFLNTKSLRINTFSNTSITYSKGQLISNSIFSNSFFRKCVPIPLGLMQTLVSCWGCTYMCRFIQPISSKNE